jgi:hypothetical protein
VLPPPVLSPVLSPVELLVESVPPPVLSPVLLLVDDEPVVTPVVFPDVSVPSVPTLVEPSVLAEVEDGPAEVSADEDEVPSLLSLPLAVSVRLSVPRVVASLSPQPLATDKLASRSSAGGV